MSFTCPYSVACLHELCINYLFIKYCKVGMKKKYNTIVKIIVPFLIVLSFQQKAYSQTTLVAGDIAFTGYIANAAGTDEFSFVLLKNVTAGTVINFTDNGWFSTNALNTTEQTLTFTTTAPIIAGKEIRISGPSGAAGATAVFSGGGSAGSCTGNTPSLATSGDQVLAYQGTSLAPTFISAIHMNVYATDLNPCGNTTAATWDPTTCGDNLSSSRLPSGLTTGVNAVWIGTQGVGASEQDNAKFNCTGPLTNVAQVRAAVNNSANWLTSNVAPPTFTLPSGCNFLNILLPLRLLSFTATIKANEVELTWKTTTEVNLSRYEIQRSTNGSDFSSIANINSASGSGIYSDTYNYKYLDLSAFNLRVQNIYYRLKSVDIDGKFTYSEVVRVDSKNNNTGMIIERLTNPFVSAIQFLFFAKTSQVIKVRLISNDGRFVYAKNIAVAKGSNAIMLDDVSILNSGLYMMEVVLVNGERGVYKLICCKN